MDGRRHGSEGAETLRIGMLGGFRVSVGDRTLPGNAWRLKKAAALMKSLALAPNHRLHREQAMELLWPDSGTKAASNQLRKALHAARRALDPVEGFRYLASENDSLVLCTLVEVLRTKRVLLVMDNCEHLVEAVAHLVDILLDACPGVRVLATSRERLGIMGEMNWLIPPLSVPDPSQRPPAEELERYESVRLFVERAR